jgi:membrane protease YdiL (CAAX protease family)
MSSPRVTEQGLQRRLVGWWVLVGLLALVNFSSNFASDEDPPDDFLYRYETAIVGAFFYLLILAIVLVIASGLNPRDAFGLRRPTSWATAIGLAFGLLIVMLIVAGLLEPVFGAGEEQGLDPPGWIPERAPAFVLNALVAAVIAPVVEELLFRGIGFYLLAQFGQLAAILVTGVAFALVHGILEGLPIFFIIGVGLAFIRSRTASIYPALIMHGGFNGTGLIVGLFT